MRAFIIASALVLCLGAPLPSSAEENAEFDVHAAPKPVADAGFLDAEGHEGHVADFKGHVTLLNLWATWCAPCIKELPSLDRLQAELGSSHFQVVALAVDRGGVAAAKAFLTKTGISHLAALSDPSAKLGFALQAPGLPTTLILDEQGREIARVTGARDWDSKETIATLKRWIKS
jgi:thiol-disulfide isomerase/thioredoxin